MESEELKLLRELVQESRERRVREASEEFNEMMRHSFMDGETATAASQDLEERIKAIREGN